MTHCQPRMKFHCRVHYLLSRWSAECISLWTFSTENVATLVSALLPLCGVGSGLSAITILEKLENFFFALVKKKCTSDEHAQKLRVIWVFEALESENKNYMTAVAHGAHTQVLHTNTHTRALPCPFHMRFTDKPNATQSRSYVFFLYLDHAIVPRDASEILLLWADWYCGFVLSLKIAYTNWILVSMN